MLVTVLVVLPAYVSETAHIRDKTNKSTILIQTGS
jgi:hypothetical protein